MGTDLDTQKGTGNVTPPAEIDAIGRGRWSQSTRCGREIERLGPGF